MPKTIEIEIPDEDIARFLKEDEVASRLIDELVHAYPYFVSNFVDENEEDLRTWWMNGGDL